MKRNEGTGEINTESRKELQERYFKMGDIYSKSNLGIIALLSDTQEMIQIGFNDRDKEHYRIILNDIKLILMREDRSRNDEREKVMLEGRVSDVLLEFAETAKEDLTTSDLQGIAIVEAKKIITIVREG